MITIMAEVEVEDQAGFITVFSTRGQQMRELHGSRRALVHRSEDPHRLVLLFAWESRERCEAFLADPAVRETMKASGTTSPPRFTFLERVCELPA